ncbi:Integral membrane protein TerC [Desulforamulus reducens MI-1]|uniref:Integral membrane protein TerC n=1 Tax=Desulforamulus reducens (strain ATCC BAA-1160 / DSM 100696 / MI-1) TaxID=349161 RepID=A4J1M1_DESRM|nr:TerC family protein [Desulforamulus reducens]ABO48974.1 Integral membrane protein TerC [Desulforamulus reducens MI-1]
MEFLTADFLSALLVIVLIDLVLAGDNAIVIGMAARNVPKEHQRQVILWGTAGAIMIRILATLAVVWLLEIPGLMLVGGLLLVWIAYKLLTEEKSHDQIRACDNRWEAIRTIIIADAVMGLDNVLAIAGTAHGSFLLVVSGLLISVPIVVWGSTLLLKWVDRFPVIIYLGAGVIALTAAKMMLHEPMISSFFTNAPLLKYTVMVVVTGGVLLYGKMKKKKHNPLTC